MIRMFMGALAALLCLAAPSGAASFNDDLHIDQLAPAYKASFKKMKQKLTVAEKGCTNKKGAACTYSVGGGVTVLASAAEEGGPVESLAINVMNKDKVEAFLMTLYASINLADPSLSASEIKEVSDTLLADLKAPRAEFQSTRISFIRIMNPALGLWVIASARDDGAGSDDVAAEEEEGGGEDVAADEPAEVPSGSPVFSDNLLIHEMSKSYQAQFEALKQKAAIKATGCATKKEAACTYLVGSHVTVLATADEEEGPAKRLAMNIKKKGKPEDFAAALLATIKLTDTKMKKSEFDRVVNELSDNLDDPRVEVETRNAKIIRVFNPALGLWIIADAI